MGTGHRVRKGDGSALGCCVHPCRYWHRRTRKNEAIDCLPDGSSRRREYTRETVRPLPSTRRRVEMRFAVCLSAQLESHSDSDLGSVAGGAPSYKGRLGTRVFETRISQPGLL
eukprot:7698945-Pyramimonas_sp.AAC.2